jgi:hypothetical protein
MVLDIPESLVSEICAGKVVAFIGAGFSMQAGLPSWKALLEKMIKWAPQNGHKLTGRIKDLRAMIGKGDFLGVAQYLEENLGPGLTRKFFQQEIRPADLKPAPIHDILTRLPFSGVVTTNYDVLLESAYTKAWDTKPRTYTQADTDALADLLHQGDFYILKAHGDIDRMPTLVFNRQSYRQVMFANPAYQQFMASLFSTRTILFLGYSLSDPDLLLLLDALYHDTKGFGHQNYALMSLGIANNIQRERWEKDYNIQIIPYREHSEVRDFLLEIERRCKGITDTGLTPSGGKLPDQIPIDFTRYAVWLQQRLQAMISMASLLNLGQNYAVGDPNDIIIPITSEANADGGGESGTISKEQITLAEAIAQFGHVMLAAPSGSGKTVSLSQLAILQCERLAAGEPLGTTKGVRIPVYLSLRGYDGEVINDLIRESLEASDHSITLDEVKALARQGHLLVLMDDYQMSRADQLQALSHSLREWWFMVLPIVKTNFRRN